MREETENYLKKEMYDLIKKDSTLFDFIQKGSLDGMWYWNLEKIEDEWMSPRFWEVLGYDPKDKKHKSSEWQDIIFEVDLKEATKNFEMHLQDPNHPYDQIIRYRHKNGTTVWIRCRGVAIRDASGKAIRMLGAHTNITDLQNQIIELNHLTKLTEDLLATLGEEVDYQKNTDHILKISDAIFVAFNLYDEDGKQYRTKAISGNKKTINKAMNIMGIKLDKRKWDHDPIRANKIADKTVTRFPTLHDLAGDTIPKSVCTLLIKSLGLGEVVLIKISKDNVILGDFTLIMSRDKTFDKDSVVEIYANQLGLVLTNFRSKEKLKQSEEHYRLLTTEMQLGLALHEIICDDQGNPIDYRFIRANESYEQLTGLKRKDIIGKRILEVLPQIEKYWIETFGEVAIHGKSIHYDNYVTELDKYFSTSVYSPKKGQFAVVVDDITEKRKQEDLLNYSQKHDKLTGLPNRNYYDEKLIELDTKENFPLGIVMMDINGLKLINDSFGQEAGNVVLRQFTKILSEEKREVDFISRTSGDEFIMLSPKTSSEEVFKFKQRLLKKVSKQRIKNTEYSIAIGFEIKEMQNQDIYETGTKAENDMYKNKIVYGQGTRSDAIESIFSTMTNKYAYEKTHSEGVAKYSRLIGEQLNLREDELDELELAGRLHDIGKIAISDDIIMNPSKLNDEEWKKIENHTVIGYQILRAADKYSNLAEYAMSHHERMDGKGYPNGLMGKDIPLFARIICVADAYEAMTSDRTYRKAMSKEVAIDELKTYSGTQFDSEIVDVFIRAILIKENAF